MIIRSILENDLYKFSMSYYYQVHYPNAWGAFTFHDRNNTQYTEEFVAALKEEFASLATLSLQAAEFAAAKSRLLPLQAMNPRVCAAPKKSLASAMTTAAL